MIQWIAILFALICFFVILFQVCLIAGAPWGRYTQGGVHAGVLPVRGKIVAAISMGVLVFLAIAMLSAAQIVVHVPRWMSWVALGIQGLSMLLNWITPSRVERLVWGPITTAMFAMALLVMFL